MKVMIEMNNGKEYFLYFRAHEIFIMDNFKDATDIQDVLMFKCAWKINPLKYHLLNKPSEWGWSGLGTKDIKDFYKVSLKGSRFENTKIEMDRAEIEIDLTKPIELPNYLFDFYIESADPDYMLATNGDHVSRLFLKLRGQDGRYEKSIVDKFWFDTKGRATSFFSSYFFELLTKGFQQYLGAEYRVPLLDSPIFQQLYLLPEYNKRVTFVRQKK